MQCQGLPVHVHGRVCATSREGLTMGCLPPWHSAARELHAAQLVQTQARSVYSMYCQWVLPDVTASSQVYARDSACGWMSRAQLLCMHGAGYTFSLTLAGDAVVAFGSSGPARAHAWRAVSYQGTMGSTQS